MEEKKEFGQTDIEEIVKKISRSGRVGSINELRDRINYLDHVRSNTTKSMVEAINYVYEEIEALGGYVTDGTEEADFGLVRAIFEALIEGGVIDRKDRGMFEMMFSTISRRKAEGKVDNNSVLCLALSPDNNHYWLSEVPKNT